MKNGKYIDLAMSYAMMTDVALNRKSRRYEEPKYIDYIKLS